MLGNRIFSPRHARVRLPRAPNSAVVWTQAAAASESRTYGGALPSHSGVYVQRGAVIEPVMGPPYHGSAASDAPEPCQIAQAAAKSDRDLPHMLNSPQHLRIVFRRCADVNITTVRTSGRRPRVEFANHCGHQRHSDAKCTRIKKDIKWL
jgi:hypothetical protein